MATTAEYERTDDLRAIFDGGALAGLSDGELLARAVARRPAPVSPERAFEALVVRHGPLVRGICRGMLRDPNDADDAFQAVFLVLARKAGSIWVGDSLAGWLGGVAYKVAARARRDVGRRGSPLTPDSEPTDRGLEPEHAELRRVVHEELSRLPDRYRGPILMCHLEGRTHEDAARGLNLPVGTVRSRLARGRDLLRKRLVRRGLAPAAVASVSAVDAGAAVPSVLSAATARAATAYRLGRTPTSELVSAVSVRWATKTLGAMSMKRLSVWSAALVVGGLVSVPAALPGMLHAQDPAPNTNPPETAAPPRGAPAGEIPGQAPDPRARPVSSPADDPRRDPFAAGRGAAEADATRKEYQPRGPEAERGKPFNEAPDTDSGDVATRGALPTLPPFRPNVLEVRMRRAMQRLEWVTAMWQRAGVPRDNVEEAAAAVDEIIAEVRDDQLSLDEAIAELNALQKGCEADLKSAESTRTGILVEFDRLENLRKRNAGFVSEAEHRIAAANVSRGAAQVAAVEAKLSLLQTRSQALAKRRARLAELERTWVAEKQKAAAELAKPRSN